MKRKLVYCMPYLLICILLGLNSSNLFAQTGELQGKVTDANSGEGVPFANISTTTVDSVKVGAQTDLDGLFTIKGLQPGTYNIKVSFVGYQEKVIQNVLVETDKINFLDVKLKVSNELLDAVVISGSKYERALSEETVTLYPKTFFKESPRKKPMSMPTPRPAPKSASISTPKYKQAKKYPSDAMEIVEYKVPLLKADECATGKLITKEQIKNLPKRKMQSIAAQSASVYKDRKASKKDSRDYYIDGIKVRSSSDSTPQPDPKPVPPPPNPDFENPFVDIQKEALSTFSIDVDKAYYSQLRNMLNSGHLPDIQNIRIEEMINYFNYQYPQPTNQYPFSINTEISQCPWETKHQLALIGLQGKKIDNGQLPPQNLVFLIDVSGSMTRANKLPLLQESFKLLVQELRPQDRVSIVTYAGRAGIVLQPTTGSDKGTINQAVDNLRSGGGTAGAQGILTAYGLAKKNFNRNGNNRVILATDGDFNIGASSNQALVELIEKERKYGIYLSILGVGMGNYKDGKMEELSNHGNGNYAYIDNIKEAEKVLVKEMSGTLQTIARDVKLQLEFNPAKVAAYRLIGYQNRMLEKEDFNDQTVDAGEIGAGHSVTALYEIVPIGQKIPENWQESKPTAAADVQKGATAKVETQTKVANKVATKAVSPKGNRKVDPLKYQLPKQGITANAQGKLQLSSAAYTEEVLTVKVRYKSPKGRQHYKFQDVLLANKNGKKTVEQASNNLKWASAIANFGLLLQNSRYKGNFAYPKVLKQAKSVLTAKKQAKMDVHYEQEFVNLIEKAANLDQRFEKATK